MNILYKQEVYIPNISKGFGKDYAILDFIIYTNNQETWIEVDGEQHIKIVRFGSMSKYEAKEKLEKQKLRDIALNKVAKDHGITLLHFEWSANIDIKKFRENVINKISEIINK